MRDLCQLCAITSQTVKLQDSNCSLGPRLCNSQNNKESVYIQYIEPPRKDTLSRKKPPCNGGL